MKKSNKGFSLVELIIVIAIMAILIGVLAPQFIKFVEKSRESTDIQNVEEIKTAIEAYVADHQDAAASAQINWTASAGNMTLTGISTDKLSEYGITNSTLGLKSKQWAAVTIDYSDYKWTFTTNGSAKYYYIDGSEVNNP